MLFERFDNLEITLDKKALEDIRREPRKYVQATLKDGDKVYGKIGIHVKGAAGSFRMSVGTSGLGKSPASICSTSRLLLPAAAARSS